MHASPDPIFPGGARDLDVGVTRDPGGPAPDRCVIRVAQPADGAALLEAILAIDRETEFLGAPGEQPPWAADPSGMINRLQETDAGAYFIAVQGDDVVGYVGAMAGEYRSTRGVVTILQIGVRREHRRHGFARALLDALETWARRRDVVRLDLTVDDANHAALGLYRQLGFVEEGRVREAGFDRGMWCSYLCLAKLLGTRTAYAAVAPRAPRPCRSDRLEIGFRLVTQNDARALRAWELALLSEPPASLKAPDEVSAPEAFARELEAALANPDRFLVAAVIAGAQDHIVGLLSVSARAPARLARDVSIVLNVLHAFRGLGVGRRLFAIGEDWARQRRVHRFSTVVHSANDSGLRFALSLGFELEVTLRRYALLEHGEVDLLALAKRFAS